MFESEVVPFFLRSTPSAELKENTTWDLGESSGSPNRHQALTQYIYISKRPLLLFLFYQSPTSKPFEPN